MERPNCVGKLLSSYKNVIFSLCSNKFECTLAMTRCLRFFGEGGVGWRRSRPPSLYLPLKRERHCEKIFLRLSEAKFQEKSTKQSQTTLQLLSTKQYREVGITGILESYEPDGKVEKWNVGKLECWKSGKMEKWKTGIMECWNVGKLMIL
jgi:hypothetical protein